MVGCHRVSKYTKRPRPGDLADCASLHPEGVKERRLLNIRARIIPLISVPNARGDLVPLRVLIGKIAVQFTEHFRLERPLHLVAHLVQAWPKITQKHVRPVFRLTKWLGC